MQEECDPAYSYRGPSGALKVIRGRGCEESFRAAVDKHIVDPDHQMEVSAKKHWLLDGPVNSEKEGGSFNNVRGAPRQSSLNAALDGKHKGGKKKPGLLKGIGSMFRFGKHRKMEFANVDVQHYHGSSEFDSNGNSQKQTQQQELHNELNNSQNEIHNQQEQRMQQQMMQQQREHLYQRHGFVHRHAEQVQVIPENSIAPPIKYRNHADQPRRGDRKDHRARHTYYQSDDQFDQRQSQNQVNNFNEYGGRPGSRSGITESVPFTHYVNYNELQNHLR